MYTKLMLVPVMGLHFHPTSGSVDFSDLFLTSSVDWTVKLWRAKSPAKQSTTPHVISPLYLFDESDDFCADDYLRLTFQAPVVSTAVGTGRALSKLQWNKKDGRHAAGGSDGRLYVYDIGDMAIPRESEWTDLQKVGNGQWNGLLDGDVRITAGR